MLKFLGGKPLLQWVWEAAIATGRFDDVVIAVDAEETAELVASFGGKYVMTSPGHLCGTERLIEVVQSGRVDGEIIVNWQGDEPFIQKAMIDDLLQSIEDKEADIWTLKKKIENPEQIHSVHIAKVVTDAQDCALFFSRSPIPCYRDARPDEQKIYYKHVGIYAYTKEALLKIATLSPCEAELAEQLEQLRFLHHGLKIKVHKTLHEVQGIDLPEHLVIAEKAIAMI
jgi:3-deoxy-manno-octulosonate cytidylyltransferase (CMP-KDO synthetase)